MNRVGVVILNYGSPDDTICLTKSLLCLNEKIDVVIVDNFSSLNNQSLIYSFFAQEDSEYLHFIKSPVNVGYGEGNNLGLEKLFDQIGCQFSLILNPDFILGDEFSLKALYSHDPDDISLYTGIIDQHGSKYSTFFFNPKNFRSKKYMELEIDRKTPVYPSGCCWGMSKKIWNEIGGFSKYLFLYFEELDFIYRYKHNFGQFPKITIIPSIVVTHLEGGATGSSHIGNEISPLADYWSTVSRVIFCRRHLARYLLIALLYNFFKMLLRLLILRFVNAKSIFLGTFRGIFFKWGK